MKRVLTLIIMLLSIQYTNAHADIDIVKTNSGQISGSLSDDKSVHIFKGIPFAAPPIGNLRWKAPQPVKPWQGIKQTTAFAASPVQGKPNEFGVYTREFLIKDEPLSEDCLYLNVWTGAKSATEKRPVIVWIYGGGFMTGGTNVPIYDGEALAKKGIILVSLAYRVGIFGFFAHPELTRESPNHSSGNYGLMDQVAALMWVQKNIAAFGGDPTNVTIAGQSAGAFSVNYLVTSPQAKGLFSKAIAESGSSIIPSSSNTISLAQAEQQGEKIAAFLQAKNIAELRKLPADALLTQNSFRPIIDGYFLPQSAADIFASNKENKVPLLAGWNEDDAFVNSFQNATDYIAGIKAKYGSEANAFLTFYPANNDAEAERSQIRNARDLTFGGASYRWANVQSAKKISNVYLYRFARRVPASPAFARYGAFHTAEVGYVFNNLKFLKRPFEPIDQELANLMSSYWVNFAKTGNPNQEGLPNWPAYKQDTSEIMLFNEKSAAVELPDKAALDFILKEIMQ